MKEIIVHTVPLKILGTLVVTRFDHPGHEPDYRWEVQDDDGSVLDFHDWDYPTATDALRSGLFHSERTAAALEGNDPTVCKTGDMLEALRKGVDNPNEMADIDRIMNDFIFIRDDHSTDMVRELLIDLLEQHKGEASQ